VADRPAWPERRARTDQLAVYGRLVAARIRADAQYRLSFAMYLTSQALVACFDLAVIFVLFANVDSLAGWTRDEVLLLYAFTGIAFGLADLFVSEVEIAARHIREGTFDGFLIRPVGALVQLCAREFALRRIGRLLQPLVVLVLVLPRLDVTWDPLRLVLVPLTIVSATVIFGAVWVATSSIVFWTVGSGEIANSFTYGGNLVTQYPVDAFGAWLQRFVVFVVPVAFVSYLPAAFILGKPVVLGLPSWIGVLTPVVAGAAALVARAVWRTALRRYRSTGS
jgi:ABC-2 type transport system permease protein